VLLTSCVWTNEGPVNLLGSSPVVLFPPVGSFIVELLIVFVIKGLEFDDLLQNVVPLFTHFEQLLLHAVIFKI
jgi:hypothetical protein